MTCPTLPAVIEQVAAAPPGRWSDFGRPLQVRFLAALADSGSVRAAARAVGVGASTVYRARRSDPAFRRAWTGALLAARALSEDVLATRALDGVQEDVWYHGEVVATRTRFDTRLLLAHLARLDKLAADAGAAAFADDFEDALERFAAGEDKGENGAEHAGPPEEEISPPEHCATCAMSNNAAPPPPPPPPSPSTGPKLQWCEHTGQMLPRMDWLMNAMDAARPPGARLPHQFGSYNRDWVEAEQMAAFEAGADRWWLVFPPEPDAEVGEEPTGWTYFEEWEPAG